MHAPIPRMYLHVEKTELNSSKLSTDRQKKIGEIMYILSKKGRETAS